MIVISQEVVTTIFVIIIINKCFIFSPQVTVEPDIWGGLASRCFLDSILSAESELVLLPFVSLWSQHVTQTISGDKG